ncbi:hypothetical protein F2Q70_00021317 [Brassica cretica]|uniref:Uncharacterized protein n=1 Tax=Brassica cretica TaxID=69181 RepID=A0A8S9GIC3_BRACR|nr:hypothetical protein F2Q70_00021317 [Brassica cretica]
MGKKKDNAAKLSTAPNKGSMTTSAEGGSSSSSRAKAKRRDQESLRRRLVKTDQGVSRPGVAAQVCPQRNLDEIISSISQPTIATSEARDQNH